MRKMSILKRLLTALLWGCLINVPAQASPLSPKQVAELYYRAWLNFDRDSMLQLQREWGSSNSEPRYVDMELIADPIAWHLKYKMSEVPGGATKEQRHQFAELMVESTRRTRCHPIEERIGSQLPTGLYLARVKMSCDLPDAAAAFQKLMNGTKADELGNGERMPSVRILRGMTEGIAASPVTYNVTTEIQLFAGEDKRIWRVGSAEVREDLGFERLFAVLIEQMVQSGLLQ